MVDFKSMSLDGLMEENNKRTVKITLHAIEKKFGAPITHTDEEIEQTKEEQQRIRALIKERLEK